MKKTIIFLFLLSTNLSLYSQKYQALQPYIITSPELYNIIESNIIGKINPKEVCTISGQMTKKGMLICISSSEMNHIMITDSIWGYVKISEFLFFLCGTLDLPLIPIWFAKKTNISFPEQKPILDGGKEWWILCNNKRYILINEVLSW